MWAEVDSLFIPSELIPQFTTSYLTLLQVIRVPFTPTTTGLRSKRLLSATQKREPHQADIFDNNDTA